ncbi:hypothetical protein CYQ92_22885 [Escherichia coli]|nr:hypothetical protein CYQ92_22885 [Escherichia coli]
MRQNAVIDILLIIVFSLSLLICGKVSAGTGWQSGGDFQGVVEFGGTITPYDDSLPPWLWKTGGYTGFSNKISELTDNGTRLTVSAPYDLPVNQPVLLRVVRHPALVLFLLFS